MLLIVTTGLSTWLHASLLPQTSYQIPSKYMVNRL